jgi:putative membrane-bound dehydrogenase-like protein
MYLRGFLLSLLTLILTRSPALVAQEAIPHHQDRPPGPALSPQEAIAKMTVPEGFAVELVAGEPDIVNPVAMTFDERGRAWITESLEYPRKAPGPGRDRVKILEDTDGDGRADKFTVFADGLNIPSGIAVGYGGVWVANSPDILFYPDADRDGRPDGPPQVIVTGFGRADTHELPNSLTWGPDGYLYGLNGVFNHSHVKYAKENPNYKADHPGWQFTCAMFRIHPVTWEFEIFCEGTSNPWGIAFDHEGSAFVSACVIDHLWHLVRTGYYHRQGGPYPPFTWKIESIVKHKHQKAAYCGLHYFDSDAYPGPYRNKLYMGNIHGNCINVDKLQRDGSTYFATGEPDFLTANDAWFMPVVQKTGPDGCLWILDWYDRYHCYQDANRDPAGIDRLKGRLYRVRYKDTPHAKPFDLAKETSEQLFERLGSGNGLMCELAHRLLTQRRTTKDRAAQQSVIRLADKVLSDQQKSRETRLRAAFVAMSPPTDALVISRLLTHQDASFRALAVRCIGNSGFQPIDIRPIESDSSPDVKLQLAIAAGSLRGYVPSTIPRLIDVLARSGEDKLIPHIVWQNLHPLLDEHANEFISAIKKDDRAKVPVVASLIPRAIECILARREFEAQSVAELFTVLRDHAPAHAREGLQLLAARVQSGEVRGEQLNQLRDALAPSLAPLLSGDSSQPLRLDAAMLAVAWKDPAALSLARQTAASINDPAARLRALSALVAVGDSNVLEVASRALSPNSKLTPDFPGQLLALLSRLDDPKVGTVVLAAYPALDAADRPKAIELLTQRSAWARQLFDHIAASKVNANLLNVNQVQRVLGFKDAELTAVVNKHYGTVRTTRDPNRERLVGQMRTLVRGTKGDPHRGIEVFNRICGQCHKIHGQGQDVGPDITANGRASLEQLLSNVFDPSLVIGVSYQARTVLITDGRIVTGLLVEDSPERVVLKIQGGKLETIARGDVEATKVSELSLMPEGVEKQLQPQEIADLFAFIGLDKHPDDPSARPIPAGEVRR